ncbi:hypothetical protein [Mycobacteroides abscessus]|uniref:hypothetical protein n=1 Tax=Mycobacteroides abscessus TaxID=36809 RepID=UPI0009A8885A|nr:hypothetical protein [Mycobacteroides abscessus]SLH41766.1 Uncharacterised protein [Mycobacteroides abscessus subsp. massiliense]
MADGAQSDDDVLADFLADMKLRMEQTATVAAQLIPHIGGPSCELARASAAEVKASVWNNVQILEKHGIEVPTEVYDYLSAPSFPARERLAEASRLLVAAANSLVPGVAPRAELLKLASDLDCIIERAVLMQIPEPAAIWAEPRRRAVDKSMHEGAVFNA